MNTRVKKTSRILGVIIGLLFVIVFIGNNCQRIENEVIETSCATEILTTTTEETTTTTKETTETTTTTTTETETTTSTTTSAAEASTALIATTTEEEIITTTGEEVITTEATTELIIETKTIEEIAKEVWQGIWSTGDERIQLLTAAGYDYEEVQAAVDKMREDFEVETSSDGLTFVKDFSRGTYYAYGGPRKGGSGRQLIDCSQGSNGIKGSIASSYLYKKYGYNHNGSRTKVYLEISGYSSMNGWYYLDDSDAGNSNVIDFFYLIGGNCPFRNQGVVKVKCYI